MRRKENPPGALRPRGPVGPARSRVSAPPPPSRMSPATWEAEAEKPAGTSRSFLLLGNKTGVRLAALLTVRWAALPDSLAAVTARTDVLTGSPAPHCPVGGGWPQGEPRPLQPVAVCVRPRAARPALPWPGAPVERGGVSPGEDARGWWCRAGLAADGFPCCAHGGQQTGPREAASPLRPHVSEQVAAFSVAAVRLDDFCPDCPVAPSPPCAVCY